MTRSDSLDQEDLMVDCGYTKVFATRVGTLGASMVRSTRTGDFTRLMRDRHPRDDSSAVVARIYDPILLRAKLREFTLKELEKATANFSHERLIGRGGFGDVFKGTLSDGTVVAVKVLVNVSGQGLGEYQAEMTSSFLITRSSYTNLLPVIGYHSYRKRKKVKVMIVYPFMVNGDVDSYLNDRLPPRSPLSWPTRKRIALGVARGILSLHEHKIIHRDIKPSNILLDEDFNAYVEDLGLARPLGFPRDSYNATGFRGDEDSPECVSTKVVFTMGYTDPECFIHGRCSRKSDVYSFGVILIQLVTGIPVVDRSKNRADIVWRAEQLLKSKEELTRHMHPDMLGMHDESEAIELLRLGLVCTQLHSRKRPLMPEVIAIMEGSGAALDVRWDNYDNASSDSVLPAYSQSKTGSDISSPPTSAYVVGAGENDRGDDDEEAYEENGGIGNQLQRAEDFQPEESSKEDQVGNVMDRHQGPQFAISCSNSEAPIDASISVAESTGHTNTSSLESDISAEIVGEDQNERRNSKRSSSQAKRCQGNSEEIATKLKGMIDQMREMELNHRMAMEEMHQKQMAMMQSMIKMQEQCIQKVNEMQSQIDRLK